MKIKQFYLDTASTGNATPWHFLDWRQNPFAVSFQIDQSGTAAHVVEYGYSDLIPKRVALSRTTTTATLTYKNHGLIAGDSLVVSGAGAPFDGTYQVASRASADAVTYTVANSGATAATPETAKAIFVKTMVHDSYGTPATANSDGNLAFSVQACRVRVTTGGAGNLTFHVSQGSN
jgi:hypothetical protein